MADINSVFSCEGKPVDFVSTVGCRGIEGLPLEQAYENALDMRQAIDSVDYVSFKDEDMETALRVMKSYVVRKDQLKFAKEKLKVSRELQSKTEKAMLQCLKSGWEFLSYTADHASPESMELNAQLNKLMIEAKGLFDKLLGSWRGDHVKRVEKAASRVTQLQQAIAVIEQMLREGGRALCAEAGMCQSHADEGETVEDEDETEDETEDEDDEGEATGDPSAETRTRAFSTMEMLSAFFPSMRAAPPMSVKDVPKRTQLRPDP